MACRPWRLLLGEPGAPGQPELAAVAGDAGVPALTPGVDPEQRPGAEPGSFCWSPWCLGLVEPQGSMESVGSLKLRRRLRSSGGPWRLDRLQRMRKDGWMESGLVPFPGSCTQ